METRQAELSLGGAARRAGVASGTLRAAVTRGEVRARREPHGRRERWVFRVDELDEDLAKLRCSYPGCDQFAVGESGGCRDHYRTLRRTDVRQAELLSLSAAARRRGISRTTLRARATSGSVRAQQVGRGWVFRVDELDEDLAKKAQQLSLTAAARAHSLTPRTLRNAVDRGGVRAEWVPRGQGETLVFRTDQLAEDLARLRCGHPGCELPGLGRAGRCRDHAASFFLSGSARPPAVVARIAAANRARPAESRRRKYPAEPRACLWCKTSLGLVPGHMIARGARRFCSHSCAAKAVNEMWRVRLAEFKRSAELLDIHELAERSGLVPGTLGHHTLPARHRFEDGRRYLYSEADVKAWVMGLAHEHAPARERWHTIEFTVTQLVSRGAMAELLEIGLTKDAARAVIEDRAARDVKRRRLILKHKRGRHKASSPAAHHSRWADRLPEIHTELTELHQAQGSEYGRAPSLYAAALQLAEEDSLSHPNAWSTDRYPSGEFGLAPHAARAGAERILQAVKRLQNRADKK